ncbi:unnamed protein product [Discosporangium mesarthrocarpum]
MLDIVELAFRENSVRYARIQGKKGLDAALASFRDELEGVRALILPIKSGAHGLNLVEANHVFLLEPLLNAAVEAQAINRVHRGGQQRATTVHRLVVRDTIEEDIEAFCLKKKAHHLATLGGGSATEGISNGKFPPGAAPQESSRVQHALSEEEGSLLGNVVSPLSEEKALTLADLKDLFHIN